MATMTVTDDQVAALRAQLAGDHEEYRHLLASLHARDELGGYTALITAAFIEAADRRFGAAGRSDDAGVGVFVDDVRARFPGADSEIDPITAERVIQHTIGRGSVSDVDGAAIRRIERLLLPLLVAEEHLSEQELDQFLTSARKLLD
jgi:hypothetical protein